MENHIHLRGSLQNCLAAMTADRKATVAFIGGSITELKGWHNMVKEDLRQAFPGTEFNFIDAGARSHGSTPNAFRFEQNVLSHGTPDLLFIDASPNDDTNGFGPREQVLGMEGIVRHALHANPYMDIVILHFIYDPFIPLLADGIQPDVILNHERVANRYRLTSANCAQKISDMMLGGRLTWQEFGGCHPVQNGHRLYADDVAAIIRANILPSGQYKRTPHAVPPPIEPQCYEHGTLLSPASASILDGFRFVSDWHPIIKVVTRPGLVAVPMLSTDNGGTFEYTFRGRAIGIYCVSGPDSGVAEYSIDAGAPQKLDMWTQWSKLLYLPWLFMLSDTLADGQHTLKFTIPAGNGCHIRNFAVNL